MERENPAEMPENLRFSPYRAERALNQAAREAVLRHEKLGQPIVIWRDGKVVWLPPEEIEVDDVGPAVPDAGSSSGTAGPI